MKRQREVCVCARELTLFGAHGPCQPLAFELHPDPRAATQARERLARFRCDVHDRPIVVLPMGALVPPQPRPRGARC